MLRPEQISNAQFTLVGKGAYRAEEVDAFLKSAADSYNQLASQNSELIKKMSILAEKIEEYRAEEDTIKTTLITAEKVAKQIRKEAEDEKTATVAAAKAESSEIIEAARKNAKDFVEKTKVTVQAYIDKAKADAESAVATANAAAESIIADANKKSADIIGDSERKLALYTTQAARLKEEVSTYKTAVGDVCTKQISLLDTLPAEPVIEDLGEDAPAAYAEEPAQAEEESFTSAFETKAEETAPEAAEPEEVVLPEMDVPVFEEPVFEAPAEEEAEPAEETEEITEPEYEAPVFEEPVAEAPAEEEHYVPSPLAEEADDAGAEAENADDEEEFTGFKINLDDIDDDDSDDSQSVFSGFFDL